MITLNQPWKQEKRQRMFKSLVKISFYNYCIFLIGDKLVAKRTNEKFRRIKCSTLAKLLNGYNPMESVYNWKGQQEEGKEEFKVSQYD